MAKLEVEIDVFEFNKIKTLFELIADNIDQINEPLKSKLTDWAESEDKGWTSWTDIAPEFIDNNNCIVMMDGVEQQQVNGYNRILQKVKVIDWTKRCRIQIVSAKSFSIKNIGFANFVEWGEDAT